MLHNQNMNKYTLPEYHNTSTIYSTTSKQANRQIQSFYPLQPLDLCYRVSYFSTQLQELPHCLFLTFPHHFYYQSPDFFSLFFPLAITVNTIWSGVSVSVGTIVEFGSQRWREKRSCNNNQSKCSAGNIALFYQIFTSFKILVQNGDISDINICIVLWMPKGSNIFSWRVNFIKYCTATKFAAYLRHLNRCSWKIIAHICNISAIFQSCLLFSPECKTWQLCVIVCISLVLW